MLVLALTVALLVFRANYSDKVYPGVVVGGMSVGGLNRTAAQAVLTKRAQSLETGTVLFTYKGKSWAPTLRQLGVSIDVNGSLDRAFDIGRETNAWERVRSTSGLLRHDDDVPLVMSWDQNTLAAWFGQVDHDLGLPPHDAYLSIKDGKVSIEPEVDGTVVDRAKATETIRTALVGLTPFSGTLPIISKIATVRSGDLVGAQQDAEQALSKPVTLSFEGQSWTLSPADLGKFIQQQDDATKKGAAAVSLAVDQQALGAWLNQQFASKVNRSAKNAVVAWSNDKQAIFAREPSVDGIVLKPLTLADDVAGSVMGNHHAIQIPVTTIKPQVDSNNLATLGITTKLAVGDSSFEGSEDSRATNIEVGTKLLNGTLVPPHTEFSFNHAIGVIEPSKGYVTAQIIQGDKIATDDGGGICQVSTTVYRAAFRAGMPITELHPHTFRLGFYELDGWQPGIDASILQPNDDPLGPNAGDFKFMNPSDHWMLVEAYTQDSHVYVILYGADLGYQVTISNSQQIGTEQPGHWEVDVDDSLPPGTINQTEYAGPGSDWVVHRTVKDRSGNVIEDKDFESDYSARHDVYDVSPDMKNWTPTS